MIAAITSCTNTSNPQVLVGGRPVGKEGGVAGPVGQALGQDDPRSSILRSWTSYREHTQSRASLKAFKLLRGTSQPSFDSQKTQSTFSNGRIGWLGSTTWLGL